MGKLADNVRITCPREVRNGTSEMQNRICHYFIAMIANIAFEPKHEDVPFSRANLLSLAIQSGLKLYHWSHHSRLCVR